MRTGVARWDPREIVRQIIACVAPGPLMNEPEGPHLQFFRFSTGKVDHIADPPKPLRYGIALSRDGRYLLHSQADYEVSDLMMVDDFR